MFIDFQRLDRGLLKDLDSLLRYIADLVSLKLKTNENPDRYWKMPLGPKDKLTTFFEEEVLENLTSPMVLLMDEVDRVFAHSEYRDDFFGLIRSWHNNRAFNPTWDRLNLVLAYSTEASALIRDQTQSPFNIGETLEANDFSREQVGDLNAKHGAPLRDNAELDSLMDLLAGHPFLVRKALYETTRKRYTFSSLLDRSADDDGPFADHLNRYNLWLSQNEDARIALKQVIRTGACDRDEDFHALRSSGLTRGHSRHAVEIRCGVYRQYFGSRL